jgi:hypothetical protein
LLCDGAVGGSGVWLWLGPTHGRRSQPALKWCGEAIEHKGEPWALLTCSEDDKPIAMEAVAGEKTMLGPGCLLCRQLGDREHHPCQPIGAWRQVTVTARWAPSTAVLMGLKINHQTDFQYEKNFKNICGGIQSNLEHFSLLQLLPNLHRF